jgi:hypothetical protein
MKKLLLSLCFISFFGLNSYADTITYNALTSDSGVSYSYFNGAFSTIYNDYNGNIATENIKADTITDSDLSAPIKFENWYTESFGDWTYSGMLPVTDPGLASDISAGTSFVNGQRIVTGATSKTYTASRDTWVYIDKNGAFQYQEVANGATQPSNPTDSLLLAKVVTNGTAITTVSDQRRVSPTALRVYQDLKSGMVISRDTSTDTKVSIGIGEIEFGSSVTNGNRRNTSPVYVDFTTTGRGGLDTGSLTANTYYYIFAVADDDNSVNFEGIASTSSTDAYGVAGERLVGWVYAPTASLLSPDSCGAYRGVGGDAPNVAQRTGNTDITTTSTTFANMPMMDLRFYSSGRPAIVSFNGPFIEGSASPVYLTLSMDNVGIIDTEVAYAGGEGNSIVFMKKIFPATGPHTFQLKWRVDAGTATQNGASDGPRILMVEEL